MRVAAASDPRSARDRDRDYPTITHMDYSSPSATGNPQTMNVELIGTDQNGMLFLTELRMNSYSTPRVGTVMTTKVIPAKTGTRALEGSGVGGGDEGGGLSTVPSAIAAYDGSPMLSDNWRLPTDYSQ